MTVEDIALTMIPGLGVRGAVHLLDLFGTAQAVFAASPAELTGDAQLREDAARAILARKGFAEAERELAYCRRHDIRPIASTDPDYPALLREIPDTVPEYDEARRLLRFLDSFVPMAPDGIPPTSVLREFIGGSSFKG